MTALRDLSTKRLKRRFVKYVRLYWYYDLSSYAQDADTVRKLLNERGVHVP